MKVQTTPFPDAGHFLKCGPPPTFPLAVVHQAQLKSSVQKAMNLVRYEQIMPRPLYAPPPSRGLTPSGPSAPCSPRSSLCRARTVGEGYVHS